MKYVIRANTLLTKRGLKVDSDGVTHVETSFFGGRRKFSFREIGCILLSSQHVLSFQAGHEVFSIPTNPGKRVHQETIQALVQGVRAAHGATAGIGRPFM